MYQGSFLSCGFTSGLFRSKNCLPVKRNTTNGIDYFNTLDFDHFAFVIHGENSQSPLSAGSYRQEGVSQKNIQITFAANSIPYIFVCFGSGLEAVWFLIFYSNYRYDFFYLGKYFSARNYMEKYGLVSIIYCLVLYPTIFDKHSNYLRWVLD